MTIGYQKKNAKEKNDKDFIPIVRMIVMMQMGVP